MKHRLPPCRSPRFDGLEPRLLFNAGAALLDTALLATQPEMAPQVHLTAALADTNTPAAATANSSQASSELGFVDASVPDAQGLVDALLEDAKGRQLELHWLSNSLDGVAQINAAPDGRPDIAAVHLITHGDDGGVQLGSTSNINVVAVNDAPVIDPTPIPVKCSSPTPGLMRCH